MAVAQDALLGAENSAHAQPVPAGLAAELWFDHGSPILLQRGRKAHWCADKQICYPLL